MGGCISSNTFKEGDNNSAVPPRGAAGTSGTRTGTGRNSLFSSNTSAGSNGTSNRTSRRSAGPAVSVIDTGPAKRNTGHNRPAAKAKIALPGEPSFHFSVNGRNGWGVKDVYDDAGVSVGKGTFGDVWKANHKVFAQRKQGQKRYGWHTVAIKKTAPTVLDRRGGVRIWTYDQVEECCQEVKTLIRLHEGRPETSCILYLYEFFWTYNHANGQGDLHLVTELLGQELDQWRLEQKSILESSVKQIANVLLNALDFLYSRNVVHRDLKLQNILFRVNGDFKTLKIVDFGLAKVLDGNEKAVDFCGSLGYIAPEIYTSRPYRFEVDMFAFGVILFRLLSAQRPFSSVNPEILRNDTINLRYKIEGKNWEGISADALKLVRNLLIGQEQRFTAAQAIDHHWFSTQEDSILKADNANAHGSAQNPDGYSEVVVLSHAPSGPQAQRDGNLFFLDAAVEKALRLLLAERKYLGRIIAEPGGNNEGKICVEETTPAPSSVEVLPRFIANLNAYTEKECRRLVRDIALIIKKLHDNGMAHRNLLLTNLLVDRTGHVLVRGLQYAQALAKDQPLTGHFGYLYNWYAFKAPEIDSEFFHDKSVDLWSLGAITYMVLTGLPPFRGDGVELVTNKHAGNVVFDTVIPSHVAQKLVEGLLQPDPKKRLTIEQVLHSEWMVEADDVLDGYGLALAHEFMQDF